MNVQPWIFLRSPLKWLWVRDLLAAIDVGFITREHVKEDVHQGGLRQSLLFKIDHCFEDTVLLPCAARGLEKNTMAPYHSLSQSPFGLWSNPSATAPNLLRRLAESGVWMNIWRDTVARLPRGAVRASIHSAPLTLMGQDSTVTPCDSYEGEASHVVVVIVNFNSGDFLARSVAALQAQTYRAFTTVVVDNASTDDSVASMRQRFPEVTVIQAPSNVGFAAGNNLAIRECHGFHWLALLNPDAFPERDWLKQLME